MILKCRELGNEVQCQPISPAEPLWKFVPTKNDEGKLLSDFMMIIPGLKHKPLHKIRSVANEIEKVLRYYKEFVVFADLNLHLNVLWVSVQPRPGICLEVAAAIHHLVPEAKVVAHKATQ
jgi:hypothetical protein